MLVVASGPSELHAHIDLDRRVREIAPHARPAVAVLTTAEHDDHWSVVADVRPPATGEWT